MDIAVLLTHNDSSVLELSECEFALREVMGKAVGLINLRGVSTVFQNEINHSGRLILQQDENALEEFEMLTMSFYQKLNEERGDLLAEFTRTGRAYNV